MTLSATEIDIAEYIDHTLLNPTATSEQIRQLCNQAEQYKFPTVCVYPASVRNAVEYLHGKKTQVCTVIGFPSGATTSAVKLYEAQEAADNGAKELDVVINLGWLKAEKTDEVHRELAEICESTGQTVKAILEMALLTEEEKRLAAQICMDAGVSYLKTSTGWFGGATVEDVSLLRDVSGGQLGIKASGGIRTYQQAIDLIMAGATRLGTSKGLELLQQRDQLFDT